MYDEAAKKGLIELSGEAAWRPGVCFDPLEITLEGSYVDELSAYRARRVWNSVLEDNFLLESDHDYVMKVSPGDEAGLFRLKCDFRTACGRYAFWRLTHNQAPEAQYLIETAHIPNSESRHGDFLEAPDLRSVYLSPSILDPLPPRAKGAESRLRWLKAIVSRLAKMKELK